MEKRKKVADVLSVIKKNFKPGQAFTGKKLKEIFLDKSLGVFYFMNQLVKSGELVQVKRGTWTLPLEIGENQKDPILYISKSEKNILDIISKMEVRSENGYSRFNLGKLKEHLSKEEGLLLVDLMPKLKSIGVMSCPGDGISGKVIEINEDIFLRYSSEPELIKEIILTDLEIDQRIKSFLSEENRKEKYAAEMILAISEKEDELLTCLDEIKRLSKTQESLEKDISVLKNKLKNESLGEQDELKKQFFKLMGKMELEDVRLIFKKILA